MIKITNEMAKPWKEIKLNLGFYTNKYLEHLMKIYCYRDSLNCMSHWIKEVYSFYNKMPKTKKNKLPKANDIYNAIYGEVSDVFPDWIDNMITDLERDYNKEIGDIDHNKLILFISRYTLWLASKLSSDGQVTYREVTSEIEDLLNIY